jgi:uncharacterized membrane protein YccC
MPADPAELERARDRLMQLNSLHDRSHLRAERVPRIGEESWRGHAYGYYSDRVDELAEALRAADRELTDAVYLARREVLDAAG